MKKNQIDFITLGCSKNLVDSEVLMKQFEANGYKCTHDSKRPQGEIAVINTCGFIGDAKEESINTILEFADAKEKGRLKKLFVMGCLSQRYRSELEKEIPQVDKYYGPGVDAPSHDAVITDETHGLLSAPPSSDVYTAMAFRAPKTGTVSCGLIPSRSCIAVMT